MSKSKFKTVHHNSSYRAPLVLSKGTYVALIIVFILTVDVKLKSSVSSACIVGTLHGVATPSSPINRPPKVNEVDPHRPPRGWGEGDTVTSPSERRGIWVSVQGQVDTNKVPLNHGNTTVNSVHGRICGRTGYYSNSIYIFKQLIQLSSLLPSKD